MGLSGMYIHRSIGVKLSQPPWPDDARLARFEADDLSLEPEDRPLYHPKEFYAAIVQVTAI